MERKQFKRNLGTIITVIGLAGVMWGVHEIPRGNEDPNKKVWAETYPTKPFELIGASVIPLIIGGGLLVSYKQEVEAEEREEKREDSKQNEFDCVSYYNLE